MVGKTSDVGTAANQQKVLHDDEERTGLSAKFHELKVGATHFKHKVGKLQNLVNANHRHDEEHEKATDAKRTRVAEGHRFQSFAPERDGNKIKWYIDGRDYFHAVSVALERAKETIYIADWWLSPELFLRRPPYTNQEWRLDYVLKRAAERGVKIYVIVYREVEAAVTCNSAHTKHVLTALCPEGTPGYGNIKVMRHPDHFIAKGADMTFYWAHHEKFIVIDYNLAFIGGLDLCFGRWDSKQHPLSDVHPAGAKNEVFPGQDFNNNRIMDFQSVEDWRSNEVSKADYGRMPWHDVAMGLIGPCIYDIAEHFVLRWNFVKRDKYKRDERYDWLTLAGRTGDDEDLVGVQRPKHPVGDYIHHPLTPLDGKRGDPRVGRSKQHPTHERPTEPGAEQLDAKDEFYDAPETLDEHGYRPDQHHHGHGLKKELEGLHRPRPATERSTSRWSNTNEYGVHHQENPKNTGNDPKHEGPVSASGGVQEKHDGYASRVAGTDANVANGYGTVHAQLVRSSADWSSGILTEQSIQNAYCEVIREAKHYVYIENQFFITATGDKQAPVHNIIGAAIVDACLSAAKENRKFRIIIMLPTIPGFAGDLRSDAATGTRAIMDYQYKSICRGEESIYAKIKAAGVDPTQYIFIFNLRSYDRLNKTPALKEIEEKSGVSYQEMQREQAEKVMPGQVHQSQHEDASDDDDTKGGAHGFMDKLKKLGRSKKSKDADSTHTDGPSEAQAAAGDKKRLFEEQQADAGLSGEGVEDKVTSVDSIAKDAMLGEKLPSQEPYAGRDENGKPLGEDEKDRDLREQEIENFVTEELYIHGKLLIVDDRIAICGSSNINDRSQLGFHDSELSIVMEDTLALPSIMDGKEFTAGHHAATLRRMLWREHLGWLPAQQLDATDDVNAQPPDDGPNEWFVGDKYDKLVEDPLNEELWNTWTSQATTNTMVFRHLFHADPDDNVKTFEEYDKFLGAQGSRLAGHLFDMYQPSEVVREQLDKIRGHIVWMPLKFLEDAQMAEKGMQVNTFTESVYT